MRGAPIVVAWVLVAGMSSGCAVTDGAAVSGTPSCAEIESFAEQLVDVGITYDYEPSNGPAELAEWVDVVIRGELTGENENQPAASGADDAYIGYEIAVDEVLAGEVAGATGTVVVSVPYNPSHADARAYANAATPGVPVIVFASVAPNAPGGLTPVTMEGFVTGCEGEAPVGWVGQLGGWSEMRSREDVATAVTSGRE
jgi:hypothetical protein